MVQTISWKAGPPLYSLPVPKARQVARECLQTIASSPIRDDAEKPLNREERREKLKEAWRKAGGTKDASSDPAAVSPSMSLSLAGSSTTPLASLAVSPCPPKASVFGGGRGKAGRLHGVMKEAEGKNHEDKM